MKKRILFGELAAEFVGSMFLVLAIISPAFMFYGMGDVGSGIAVIGNAIAVGFMLFVLVAMFGSVSGAHFNPVVTMVMLFEKNIAAGKAGLYIFIQVLGGIAGAATSHLMFWNELQAEQFLGIAAGDLSHGFVCEVAGTFILVLGVLMLVKVKSKHLPMAVGFLVGGQILATSSNMFGNPQVTIARMLSPTVAGIRPQDALVFIGMQIAGALLAYLVYRIAFKKLEIPESN